MIYTNKLGLPEYVEAWLSKDDYDYEDNVISATSLLKPTRQVVLSMRHRDDLVQDISDNIASKIGSALHSSFEGVLKHKIVHEKRVYCSFNVNDKEYKVSGKFDMLIYVSEKEQKLVDIKTTSVWTYIKGSRDDDYVKQLSVYKYLANKNGYNVIDKAEICYIFTDWSKSKAKSLGYPDCRIKVKEINLMPDTETESFILKRLIEIDEELSKPDSELKLCTDEELWRGEPKYIVGDKKMEFYNKEEALNFAKCVNGTVTEQKAAPKRCEYCNVRSVCSQYKKEVELK